MFQYSAIDLQKLQNIFDNDIFPYSFNYTLEDGKTIELRFEQSQLSHLLGIQKIDYSRADLKGQLCYEGIKNGSITFTLLKSINRAAVRSECKEKMRYFDELPNMLRNPDCVSFDSSIVGRKTRILMSFALYGNDGQSEKRLILGIDSENDNRFFPRTWLIERINGVSLLDGQSVKKVSKVEVLPR